MALAITWVFADYDGSCSQCHNVENVLFTRTTINSIQSGPPFYANVTIWNQTKRSTCVISLEKSSMQQESYCYSLKESMPMRFRFHGARL